MLNLPDLRNRLLGRWHEASDRDAIIFGKPYNREAQLDVADRHGS